MLKSTNPFNNQVIAMYDTFDGDKINSAISNCAKSQALWRLESLQKKLDIISALSNHLKHNKTDYSQLITLEMGKVAKEASSEIDKCIKLCDYYSQYSHQLIKDEIINTHYSYSAITYQPLGIILGIMPWNFPFWQVFRFAIPSLIMGNGILLKHAPNVTQCALAIEQLFELTDLPKGLFKTLLVNESQVESIIQHPSVSAVTLTGSKRAGQAVASIAGQALKKAVLELGGNDPYIILDDADIKLAVECCLKSRLINAGQSCIAAKRFIVLEPVYEAFLSEVTSQLSKVTIGDPTEPSTDIGPMVSIAQRDNLHMQVQRSIELGANCLMGGSIPNEVGAFYPPTLLTNITASMPAYHEELFGPVASVIKAADCEEAIKIANDTEYGLGAAIFTQNTNLALDIAQKKLNVGNVFINDFVQSHPKLPFGGIKSSGYGRELGQIGLKEFSNIKTLCVS